MGRRVARLRESGTVRCVDSPGRLMCSSRGAGWGLLEMPGWRVRMAEVIGREIRGYEPGGWSLLDRKWPSLGRMHVSNGNVRLGSASTWCSVHRKEERRLYGTPLNWRAWPRDARNTVSLGVREGFAP